MRFIGKADKFYTLWEVTEEHRTTSRGQVYKVIHHQYIKNISFDREKAMNLYPGVEVDESLRGHSSWTSYDYPKPPVDEFSGGKYRGEKIAECKDYPYLHWCYSSYNCIPYESREMVGGILEKVGYRKINDSHIATPEEVAVIEKSFAECAEAEEKLESTGSITIVALKNLDDFGHLSIGSVEFIFPNYKELEYAGYPYGLPINSKGQAKRIKNKEIEIIPESYELHISEYGWGATLMVTVKDFNIE